MPNLYANSKVQAASKDEAAATGAPVAVEGKEGEEKQGEALPLAPAAEGGEEMVTAVDTTAPSEIDPAAAKV